MSALGSLGPRRRRRSGTNGVFGGFGAVPSQYWPDDRVKAMQAQLNSILGSSGCSTTLKVDGLIGPGTCGALAWAKSGGSPPSAYVSASSDMDAACRQFTPRAPSCPAAPVAPSTAPSGGNTYGLPFPVGVKNDTAHSWQYMLNSELGARGLPTVPEDGVFSLATCDGFVAFVRSYKADPNNPTPDDAFAQLVVQYQNAIVAACQALAQQRPAATTAAIAPTGPAAPTSAQVLQMQQLLNSEVLRPGGYTTVPEDGRLGAATCGAASDTASAASIGRITISSTLQSLLNHPGLLSACLPLKPWQFPKLAPSPVSSRSPALPPLNRDGECVVNFGQTYAEIGVIQQQLNDVLIQNGFMPIPVTNTWDAATCGALFELGGKFSPKASSACPHYYSVPLTCPTVTKPRKPVIAMPPLPRKKINPAIPLGIAALVAVSALVIAKKKGLIMAGKAAAA